jgi:hypothetical protein
MIQAITDDHLFEGLQEIISAGAPLAHVVSTLREYRDQGASRREVYTALEALREKARVDETEDRILEVMDIVSGFCSPHLTVWSD